MSRRVAIIGGGAAGLFAAITAARAGAEVTVFEAGERPGRKLLATGNGKCNLTNLQLKPDAYRGSAAHLADVVITQFDVRQTMDCFAELGLAFIERDGWVYPRTEQAASVLEVLLLAAADLGVHIRTLTRISGIETEDESIRLVTEGWTYETDAVVIACGSPASAIRGASDDAQLFAEQLGVSFAPFYPALVPLRVRGDFCRRWAGVRVRASVTLLGDDGQIRTEEGNLQLTDYGISGIPVFQISRHLDADGNAKAALDFLPDIETDSLVSMLAARRAACPYKDSRQILTGLIPEQLIALLTEKDDPDEAIARRIKHFPLVITGRAALKHAQIASGGIGGTALREDLALHADPRIFAAGEAVDIDGPCGGYNLQWAWSSGYVAGLGAAGNGGGR